jgi:conjugative relaxase-like TrwC/TraI family protein
MLRIIQSDNASAAKGYYTKADYYLAGEQQEEVGRWRGLGAAVLGLEGEVGHADFEALCENRRPGSRDRLTPRNDADRTVGYDFNFHVPKSVSLLHAMTGDERVLEAFRASVDETMREIEAEMKVRVRRDGQDADRTAGNMVWAEFIHHTARPVEGLPDPHLHAHCFVFNAAIDQVEGRWKAGQFRDIKRDAPYFQAAFHARLAERLQRLGFGIERTGDAWELSGFARETLRKFSRRTGLIEELAEEHGIASDRQKSELGAKTRDRKRQDLTLPELRRLWDEKLTDRERETIRRVAAGGGPMGTPPSLDEAISHAVRHCFEQFSVVPVREIERVALEHGIGGVLPGQIRTELPRFGVIQREREGSLVATTREAIAEERFITSFARSGLGTVRPVGVPPQLDRGPLGEGQWNVVRSLLGSSNRVNLVEGPAGTGKSTMLKVFDVGMKMAGEEVTYLATTTAAVDVLRGEGFRAETVAYFLTSARMQAEARGRRVVVDEGSQLGHGDAFRLSAAAKSGNMKLIFLGDAMQHGSVPRGALLRLLKEHGGVRPLRLREIRRQEGKEYRSAVELLSRGKTAEGFDALDELGWVRELPEEERNRTLAEEYTEAVASGEKCLVVSPTHFEGERITSEIRRQLKDAGLLSPEERAYLRLVPVAATEAERGLAQSYRPGDVLQFHQNAKGYRKGDRLVVSDPASLPLQHAAKFQLYRPEAIGVARGDVLRFTANLKTRDGKHRIANGAAFKVRGFDDRGGIVLENGWTVAADAGHFRHGFVETSFGAQGRTVDRVILGMSSRSLGATNREQMYVSGSRARKRLSLYTDDKEAIRAAVRRSSQKLTASDLIPDRRPAEQLRRQAERVRVARFYAALRSAWENAGRPQPERRIGRER